MVKQILADDRSAAAVEIHGSDIGRIVGDEEISVDTGEDSEEHLAGDSHGIGKRKHRHHYGTLRVDEDGDGEEHEGNGPRIVTDDGGEHLLDV